MKIGCMLLILILLHFNQQKPKFKYFDISIPAYIHVSNLKADLDDSVSHFLKDTLIGIGANLISSVQRFSLFKQYLEDVKENIRNLNDKDRGTSAAFFNKAYGRGTASQSFTITYTSSTSQYASIENCDSIGFTFLKIPFKSMDQKPIRKMWHINEVGTKFNNSIALFILKKM